MERFDYMVCEPTELTVVPFAYGHCETPLLFQPISYDLPFNIFGTQTISLSPFQFHAAMLVIFASFIAPFNGFLASGYKRAIGIKDFANTIPGHGGLVDRFDCHIYMVRPL